MSYLNDNGDWSTLSPAARERLELLDLLLETMADGFLDWHLDSGLAVYSERLKLLLGFEDETEPPQPWTWLELAHPEDRGALATALGSFAAGDWPFDMTFRVKHRVAGWRWLRGRGAAHRDASGDAVRLVIAFGDVSSQVRAELRQSSLLAAVPDLLIRVGSDASVIDVKKPEQATAYVANVPMPGDRLSETPFASSWWPLAAEALSAALTGRQTSRFEARHKTTHTGAVHPDIEVRVMPSTEDEALFVIRDITAEKSQRDQSLQSQKLEAIGQLAAGIAHEINTPLQFVGDNLHFLAEAGQALTQLLDSYRSKLPSEMAPGLKELESELDIDYMTSNLPKAFSAAIDGVQRVSVIVQAMKEFAHPGPKERRPENLNQAIETTITISTNVWKYVAQIERRLADDLPRVDCVIGEINQVLLNLITNAAHAISDVVGDSGAKGVIRISTLSQPDCVEVRIADTGRGIPESIRPRIFEPFFTTKPVGKGTGQGLALARAIVVQHDGTLEFETELGQGTTFIIKLPRK
ncbi:MAG TPA: ATP-binding protein [Polyangiaceae bacterium]